MAGTLQDATALMLNGVSLSAAYLGDTQVWSAGPPPWTPNLEPSFLTDHSAYVPPRYVNGGTRLDAKYGPITLAAPTNAADAQPDYTTLADGMPAYLFASNGKVTTPLAFTAIDIPFTKLTIATLIRATAATAATQAAVMSLNNYVSPGTSTNDITFEAGPNYPTNTMRARIAGSVGTNAFLGATATPPAGQWVYLCLEIDAPTGNCVLYSNGTQIDSGTAGTLTNKPPMTAYYIGARRSGDFTLPMEWAETVAFTDYSPELRANLTDYFKRQWGTRMSNVV